MVLTRAGTEDWAGRVLTGGPQGIPPMESGYGGHFVGHFESSCYRMSIPPCHSRNAMFISRQSALSADGNSSGRRDVGCAFGALGDVGRAARELRNLC